MIEAYVYIYKKDGVYYLQTQGTEDDIVIMVSSAIVYDPRLADACNVATTYLTDYGSQNLN